MNAVNRVLLPLLARALLAVGALAAAGCTSHGDAGGSDSSTRPKDLQTDVNLPPLPNILQGLVFDAYDGPIANVEIDVWVQTRTMGYSLGPGFHSGTDGRYQVSLLPSEHIQVSAAGLDKGYVQPCAVTFDMNGDVVRDIELVSKATLNSPTPPRPITAHGPALTGTVYEMTATGRQPVAGAFIWVDGLGHLGLVVAQTMTDLNGRYFLCDLPAGAVYDIYKDGFIPKPFEAIDTSQSTTFDFEIERE